MANPTGSVHAPIDARGVTEKFRGINPRTCRPTASPPLRSISNNHSVRELLSLLDKNTGLTRAIAR